MSSNISVIKRDGSKVPLDISKIFKMTSEACEGLDVSESELQLNAKLKFFNGIKSSEIQETLIRSAGDLITEEAPDYQYVASRLINYSLRKEVYGAYKVPDLYEHVKRVVAEGFYESKLLEWYSEDEWRKLDSFIDHTRDFTIAYAGMDLFRDKYLVRNRVTKEFKETPQVAMMLIAATFFHKYEGAERLKTVREFYDALSTFEINMPTPIMAGMRTTQKQFSSCVLVESDDTLDSIFGTTAAVGKYIANRAGIGIGAAKLRAVNDPIREGDAVHTGKTPFYRVWESAVGSCNQGNLRKGSATLSWVGWDIEFEDLIVLKNNKGTPETRVRNLDYCVQLNRLFYERLIQGGNITLFSTRAVPGLLDAFYVDYDKFKALYEAAEKNPKIRKKTLTAADYFAAIMQERKDTHRIYIANVDNVNVQGPYFPELAPLRMTNLCVEIYHPTEPVTLNPDDGIIGLCTLAAVNAGKVSKPADFERVMRLIVRALNELLDYQDYPVAAGARGALTYRQLGIGIVGFAHWMAKNHFTYSGITTEGLSEIDKWLQYMTYYGLKASCDLAKEKGKPFPAFHQSKYSQGILPIHTYKKTVDELVPHEDVVDWEGLSEDIKKYGLYNGTLFAGMPVETSSLVSNSPNSWEPARALVSVKENKGMVVRQVVPEIKRLAKWYELLWDMPSPEGYMKIVAIIQKYFDLALSVNTTYNPKFYPDRERFPDVNEYPDGEIPMSVLIEDLITFFRYGGKNLYYFNMPDDAGEENIEENCVSCVL